jgi:dephospho-CoA kinase
MTAVVCLSGEIASGKTTVAQALAEQLSDVAVRSFGDVVRNRARSQGKPLDRATLQATGLELVAAGWKSFVDALLEDVSPSVSVLVVEGIRHREAIEELQRRFSGDSFVTVFLKLEPAAQRNRLERRGESLAGRDHAIEASLPEVEALADLVIDGAQPLLNTMRTILATLPNDTASGP